MIIDPEKFFDLYSTRIKENASMGGCSVVIFVAPDPDSVAACRILTALLQSEFIVYAMKPVCGYEYLLEEAEKVSDDIKTVIMLNCGSVVNVEELFGVGDSLEEKDYYVIDSHRPFHQDNIDSIYVHLLDASTNLSSKNIENPPTPEEPNENDDDEKPVRRRMFDFDDSDDEEEDEEEEEDEPKRKMYDDLDEIDFATSYSTSISMLLYDLASRLNKESNELLWLGIIGFTDQVVHYKIDSKRQDAEMDSWKEEVTKLNPSVSLNDKKNGILRIDQCSEYRFMAYRHWNLYDSMYHSSFIASRLGIWKSSNSRNILKRMLAKMGLPLEQCSQPYTMMDMKTKRQLVAQLKNYTGQFNLNGLSFESFQLTSGYTKSLSAVDAVYSLSGILEAKTLYNNGHIDENQWKKNFTDAYASLSNDSKNSWDLVMNGIQESIELQKAIVKQGGLLIENKHITMVGQFRYAWLTSTTCNPSTLSFFTGSLGLTKLALFLQEIFSQMRRRSKPIVLGALNEQRETFLVVGISTSPTRNMFGHVFEKAAIDTGARIQLHTFDGAVVEIARSDAKLFIEHLQYGLSV